MSDFYRTQMGHRFYESTMPRIAAALERLAAALEKASTPTSAPRPEDVTQDSRVPTGEHRG